MHGRRLERQRKLERFAPVDGAPAFIAFGFLTSIATGVAAGGYPAWKAAHLEVMEAL